MALSFTQPGYPSLMPYLMVADAERLVGFLREAFEAEELALFRGPDGAVRHGAFRLLGGGVVELGQAQGEWTPLRAGLHVYVPDTDAVYRRALAAGGKSLYEPADMPYGERSGGVEDPEGNHWYIATFRELVDPEEISRRMNAC